MGKHYVDNKELYRTLLEFKEARLKAEAKGYDRHHKKYPKIPNYVGECLLQIANRLSYKPNFANYMFREEMVGDGIENCLRYMHNFNPEKTQNPFAYFTQIIYYAFLRRIQKEKKYLYTKFKATENANITGETADMQGHDTNGNFDSRIKSSDGAQEYQSEFIQNFEKAKMKKVVK